MDQLVKTRYFEGKLEVKKVMQFAQRTHQQLTAIFLDS